MGKIQSMLTLDGESEFRRQLNLINSSLKTLDKELQATSTQLVEEGAKLKQTADISTNYGRQMDFLKAKHDLLRNAMANAEKEIKNNSTRLDNAKQAYADASKQVETAKNAVATWTKITGASSAEVTNAKAALAKYEEEQRKAARELSQAEKAAERTAKAYISYKTQLAETETAINKVTAAQEDLNSTTEEVNKSIGGGGAGLVSTVGALNAGLSTAVGVLRNVGSVMSDVAGVSLEAFKLGVKTVNTEIDLGIKGLEAYSGAFAAAGTAVGGFAASNGMSFEASMAKVKAYSGASEEEMERLTEAAKQVGATTTKTATEAADALGFLALNGWKTEDMLNGITAITKAAEAGDMDLATVANLTSRSLTAYGKSAADAMIS